MHGLQRIVQGRVSYGATGKTFVYHFDVDSPTLNHYRIRRFGSDVRGVCHADEVSYIFKNSYGDVPERDSMEFKSIQRFVSFSALEVVECVCEHFLMSDSSLFWHSRVPLHRFPSSPRLQRAEIRTTT